EAIPAMLRLVGRVVMGGGTDLSVHRGECVYVPTGAPLPEGADAVAMVEYCDLLGDQVLVKKPMANGENMVRRGEDFASGELVLTEGRRLSIQDTGALAAVGKKDVPVRKKPLVGVISTGSELVPVDAVPTGGQVRDVNSYMCRSFLDSVGCESRLYGIVRDDRESLGNALRTAMTECDGVLISGGSSKDDRDMCADLIRENGEVLVHGIALAPGKPTIIGRLGRVPVLGLPGHPASALVVMTVIGRPLFRGLTGERESERLVERAILARNVPSMKGREDYIRVFVKDGCAHPLFGKSGLLNTLVRSNALIRVPAGSEGFEQGDEVEVFRW
ncbi:MAG: molybdopterin molybdotransferase MoeA, partial [Methanolinea sp.]|nr:molybdopterin molybdotransferase MoeA [Methanolinea sp.]